MIDPVRERLEAYSHTATSEKIVVELPMIKNFPKERPEGLKAETFPDVYPMDKPIK